MHILNNINRLQKGHKKSPLTHVVLFTLLAFISITAHAGKITSIPSATVPGVQDGFGGFNLNNAEVIVNGVGSSFDESTGAYVFGTGPDTDYEYIANIYDDESQTTLMGHVVAKPYPVGEPAGIKIVNDDFDVKVSNPTNCILSTSYLDGHFLDEADPQPVPCSGPFQAHKRYKQPMLPITVASGAGNEKPLDLVFNVEAEAGSRDYQVFQKINNWTDHRLKGFTIQVGTGLGGNFVPASDLTAGVGVANLSLSVPGEVWAANQLANFSTGLFGPLDTQHGRPAGYFDPDTVAGFEIVEYPNVSGQTDTLTSGNTLGSDYAAVPPATGAAADQFGDWLPNNMLPYGIFFDDDGNPDTDAELVAWYGDKGLYNFGWMTGVAGGFATVDPNLITDTWSNNPLYFMGEIDDLVNVGLNYIVTVGDVSGFSNSTFTIRITPIIADAPLVEPTYVGEIPTPALKYTSSVAEIRVDPSPSFIPGSLLTARISDADGNIAADAPDTVDVYVSAPGLTTQTISLEELGDDRGVFAGNLPDEFSNVALGTTVTVTYNDGANGPIQTFSTAATSLPAGNIQFNPASYTVAENGGSIDIIVERIDGSTGEVIVDYATESGTATGNEDYVPNTGALIFADTETSKTITVAIIDDTAVEGDESFSVRLTSATGGATIVGANPATVTITDTDIDPDAPVPPPADDSSGCSCSSSPDGSVDPLLPGLLLASLIYLGWRSKQTDIEVSKH